MQKVTLYMESTKKSAEQTLMEIQSLLKKFGIRDLLTNYGDDGEIKGVSFTIMKEDKLLPFRLPIDHKSIWEMARAGKTRYIRDEQQARRVAWRQIFRWIEAQTALILTQMVSVEEIFLPYLMIDQKTTIYEKFLNNGFDGFLITDGSE